jgi:hypothetical protein
MEDEEGGGLRKCVSWIEVISIGINGSCLFVRVMIHRERPVILVYVKLKETAIHKKKVGSMKSRREGEV